MKNQKFPLQEKVRVEAAEVAVAVLILKMISVERKKMTLRSKRKRMEYNLKDPIVKPIKMTVAVTATQVETGNLQLKDVEAYRQRKIAQKIGIDHVIETGPAIDVGGNFFL